jgi:hypothetical protein
MLGISPLYSKPPQVQGKNLGFNVKASSFHDNCGFDDAMDSATSQLERKTLLIQLFALDVDFV